MSSSLSVFMLCGAPLVAQQPALDLRQLIDEALRRNPEILAAQKRVEAARERPTQASALPDPTLSLGYASNGGPLPFQGIGIEPTSNVGFMVSQQFPAPGKRRLRGEIAQREAEAELEEYQATRLSVLTRVKAAYHQLHHTYEAVDVLSRNRDLLRQYLRAAETRYSVGRAAQQDLFKAQTQLSLLEVRMEKMLQERRMAEAAVNALLSRHPMSPLGRPADPGPPEWNLTLDRLFEQARSNSPAVRRELKMIQRSELSVDLARKDYLPEYTLSGGYFYMGRMPDMYQFRADISLPLWWRRKQQPGVAEQSSLLAQTRRSFEATDQAIHARIRSEYELAESAFKLMQMYQNTLIPQAQLTLESSVASYETGAVDFLTLLTNATSVLDYELNYHEEMLSFHQALVRLEEATGTELL